MDNIKIVCFKHVAKNLWGMVIKNLNSEQTSTVYATKKIDLVQHAQKNGYIK